MYDDNSGFGDASLYQSLALRSANPALSKEERVANGILGLCGEAGEIADLYKKYKFQGHTFDARKLIDELGDVLWYCALLSESVGLPLGEVMAANIAKLRARYPEGFSVERSVNRGENEGSV